MNKLCGQEGRGLQRKKTVSANVLRLQVPGVPQSQLVFGAQLVRSRTEREMVREEEQGLGCVLKTVGTGFFRLFCVMGKSGRL